MFDLAAGLVKSQFLTGFGQSVIGILFTGVFGPLANTNFPEKWFPPQWGNRFPVTVPKQILVLPGTSFFNNLRASLFRLILRGGVFGPLAKTNFRKSGSLPWGGSISGDFASQKCSFSFRLISLRGFSDPSQRGKFRKSGSPPRGGIDLRRFKKTQNSQKGIN